MKQFAQLLVIFVAMFTASWFLPLYAPAITQSAINTPLISTAGKGYFWPFGFPNVVGNMATFAGGGTGRIWQFVNNSPNYIVVNKIQEYINTAVGTSCTGGTCGLSFAIYDSACTTMMGDTTPVTTGTGQTRWTMKAAVSLIPGGIYYLAAYTDSTAAVIITYSFDGSIATEVNNVAARWGTFTGSTQNGASVTFPATCGTITAVGVNPPDALLEP
jgi:hypothetical protein